MTSRAYGRIQTIDQLRLLADKLLEAGKPVGFDIETGYTGPDRPKGSLDIAWAQQFACGFSITNDKRWARYVPVAHDKEGSNLDQVEAWTIIKPVLETLPVVAHNMKFEKRNLRTLGWKGRGPAIEINVKADTMLEAFVLSEWESFGLKELTLAMFGHKMRQIEELFPDLTQKQAKALRFNVLDPDDPEVIDYACEDAAWCLAINESIGEKAKSQRATMWKVEHEVMELLCDLEDFGMNVAWDEMAEERKRALPFYDRMEQAVKDGLGQVVGRDLSEVNLASPPQLKKVLYSPTEGAGFVTTRLTKTADSEKNKDKERWEVMSTDKYAMEDLARKHPEIKKMLELREVKNAFDRFKKWLDENHEAEDNRVHANFSQTIVGTGRFSADGPPVQQMPKKWKWSTKVGLDTNDKEAFEAFVKDPETQQYVDYWTGNFRDYVCAPAGKYLMGYDYSQIELRVLAGVSQEPLLLKAFADGADVHTLTAAMMLDKAVEDVDEEVDRPVGKTMNFALIYQMGVKSLAERLALSMDRAQELYDRYFAQFASVRTWMDDAQSKGRRRGYTESPFGRKYTVWEAFSNDRYTRSKAERVYINAPIQGGAADYMKLAMIRVRRELMKRGMWGPHAVMMIHNLHDALVFEVDNSIDPNELRAILEPQVVFPVKNFPQIVADWELGQRHGSCAKWKLNAPAVFDGTNWVVGQPQEPSSRPEEAPEEPAEAPVPEEVSEDSPVVEVAPEPVVEDDGQVSQETRHLSAVPDPGDVPGREVVVAIEQMPTERQLQRFVDFMLRTPGNNVVVLSTPEGDVRCKAACGLDTHDQGTVSMIFGRAVTRRLGPNIDVGELSEGIAL